VFVFHEVGAGPLLRIVSCDMKLHSVLLGWSNPDQVLRVAAGIPRKHASDGLPRKVSGLLSEVWSLSGNVSNLVASNRERARIGGHGQN
jgi:hypothetical protein